MVSYIHGGGRIGVLVEVNCETDFVARNEDFVGFTKSVAMQIAAMNPDCVRREEFDPQVLERERVIAREKAIAEGKPEKILDRIVDGQINKLMSERVLLEQEFVKENKKTIEQLLKELGEDPQREGLDRTPERVATALRYLTSGYAKDPREILNDALFSEEYDEMVVVKDIDVFSLCVPSKQIVNAVDGAKPARLVRAHLLREAVESGPRFVGEELQPRQVEEDQEPGAAEGEAVGPAADSTVVDAPSWAQLAPLLVFIAILVLNGIARRRHLGRAPGQGGGGGFWGLWLLSSMLSRGGHGRQGGVGGFGGGGFSGGGGASGFRASCACATAQSATSATTTRSMARSIRPALHEDRCPAVDQRRNTVRNDQVVVIWRKCTSNLSNRPPSAPSSASLRRFDSIAGLNFDVGICALAPPDRNDSILPLSSEIARRSSTATST